MTEIFAPYMVFFIVKVPLLFEKQRLQLPVRSQIIVREIQIFVSHRSVTSTDSREYGVKKIYRRNHVTGEG